MTRAVVLAMLLASGPPVVAQEVGRVTGRVLDAATGDPVAEVVIRLADRVTTSNTIGAFRFDTVAAGEYDVSLEHLAYEPQIRPVTVEPGAEALVRAELAARPFALSPLIVDGLSELEERRLTSGHSINEVRPSAIDNAARAGMNLEQFLRGALPGVHVRPGPAGRTCVTYRPIRTDNDRGDCNGISVVLDGVPVSDPGLVYTSLPLDVIERLEVLSPGQAGVRYGMRTGQGVLLIETKRPERPLVEDRSQYMTGFDWTGETDPYPWKRVFGSTFAVNAVAVGATLLLADQCFWTPAGQPLALRTRCGGVATAGASLLTVALPAGGGAFAARWAGSTERSRGRLAPSVIVSGLVLTGGYLMLIGGEGNTRTAGLITLGLAVPTIHTLSDRLLRVRRAGFGS